MLTCSCVSASVLRGLPRQTWPVCQGVQYAANESGLLHAHAIHTSCTVGLLSGPEVRADLIIVNSSNLKGQLVLLIKLVSV